MAEILKPPPSPLPFFTAKELNRRALFITYGASHIAKIAPVVRALQQEGVECLVLALTIGYKRALALGLNPLGYKDFMHLVEDPDDALMLGQNLLEGNTHPDVETYETLCYLGVNYQEWVDVLGAEGAAAQYAEKGRLAFMPLGFMRKVVQWLQPGVVVATSTPRSEEAGVRVASLLGIPTLTMVDLFAPLNSDPFLVRAIHADRITVVSDQVRDNFVEFGLSSEQIVVTGSPDFDALYDAASIKAGAVFLQRWGWQKLRVVMWAGILEPVSTASTESISESSRAGFGSLVEKQLRKWVADRDDVALIVRYHPSHYHQFPVQPKQDRVYVSNSGSEPITPLLHASDVVVNQVSTVGFEAALLRKRVINLAFSAWMTDLDFDLSSLGPSEPAYSLDDLIDLLNSQAASQGSSKMTVPEGPAAPRVAAEILKLLKSEKRL